MNRERKAQQEEAKTPKELTESQFVRHEQAKEVNDMVGNIANDIWNMFETSNQESLRNNAKAASPNKEVEVSYKKAQDSEMLPVETGYIPDWAQTNIEALGDKAKEGGHQLDNAESCLTLTPSESADPKNSTGKFCQDHSSGEKGSESASNRK